MRQYVLRKHHRRTRFLNQLVLMSSRYFLLFLIMCTDVQTCYYHYLHRHHHPRIIRYPYHKLSRLCVDIINLPFISSIKAFLPLHPHSPHLLADNLHFVSQEILLAQTVIYLYLHLNHLLVYFLVHLGLTQKHF